MTLAAGLEALDLDLGLRALDAATGFELVPATVAGGGDAAQLQLEVRRIGGVAQRLVARDQVALEAAP